MKIYVAAVKALRKKERQDEILFTTEIGGKTYFGSQLFRFVKFSFPVTRGLFSPPNRRTLHITLLYLFWSLFLQLVLSFSQIGCSSLEFG